ncbi:MAG TPA: hypothetical protein VGG01_11675 [Xanthobacteraceae bacterium]
MADFYPLISDAVAKLPENTAAARRALYERVRVMLVRQLQSGNPTISEAELARERRALDEAIDRIEAEARVPARAARSAAMPPARPATTPPPKPATVPPDRAAAMPMDMPVAAPRFARPARAAGGGLMKIAIGAAVIIVCVLVAAYFFHRSSGTPPVASVPAGNDAMTIKGLLTGYRGATSTPTDVLLLHVRCGAAVVEQDAAANPQNPSGHLDDRGRFSITVKKAYFGQIIKVGVRASAAAADELHQDFLVLGFYADGKLELLAGADGKTIKISPQGAILNPGALRISSIVAPAMVATHRPDGNVFVSGGNFAFDDAC